MNWAGLFPVVCLRVMGTTSSRGYQGVCVSWQWRVLQSWWHCDNDLQNLSSLVVRIFLLISISCVVSRFFFFSIFDDCYDPLLCGIT